MRGQSDTATKVKKKGSRCLLAGAVYKKAGKCLEIRDPITSGVIR